MPEELSYTAEIVGFCVLIIIAMLFLVAIVALLDVFILKRKEPEESAIEHPERINLTYDSTGNIKQLSKELRQLRKGGK
jgi:flagellar basal body-associated protein FliL